MEKDQVCHKEKVQVEDKAIPEQYRSNNEGLTSTRWDQQLPILTMNSLETHFQIPTTQAIFPANWQVCSIDYLPTVLTLIIFHLM